jgi:deoxycytidine triphosphate deaminase
MLSSDLIAYYNEKVGGMIGPWDEKLLKPASYELTLGAEYMKDGQSGQLTDDDPWLEIPQNSIVFVSMSQWVRLPHYIAARFDLAIEFIYQGILLGTGPQVDPGFMGYLSCPLHNISSDSVHIRLGKPFAKMDFTKTSGLAAVADVNKITSEEDLYAAMIAGNLQGVGNHPVRLFNADKRWRPPIFALGYAGERRVKSSVKELEGRVTEAGDTIDAFGDDIRRMRRFALASAVGVVLAVTSLLLALAQLDRSYTDAKVEDVRAVTTRGPDPATTESLERTRRELNNLRVQVADLRGQLRALQRQP